MNVLEKYLQKTYGISPKPAGEKVKPVDPVTRYFQNTYGITPEKDNAKH